MQGGRGIGPTPPQRRCVMDVTSLDCKLGRARIGRKWFYCQQNCLHFINTSNEVSNYLFSWVYTILVIFIALLHNAVTQEQSRLRASKMQSEEGREGTAPKPFQVSSHSSGTRTHGPALFWFIVCGNWQLATRPCKGHAYLTTALGGCEGGGGFPKNLTEETTSVMYVASGQKSEKCSNVIFAFP